MSTLSVEISSSASSTSTVSPIFLSQRVTVPSVTLSPSSGSTTSLPSGAPPAAGASATGAPAGGASAVGASDSADAGSGAKPSVEGASGAVATCSAVSGASSDAEADPPSPIFASTAPTSTVSSSWTKISSITPLTGDGISVSTLSVEISSSPSSASTVSPTFLSQRVTVPSVTLSPSAGRTTEVLMCMTPSECRCRFPA